MKPLFLIEQRIDKHKKNKIQHQFEVNQGYFLDQLLGKKFRDKKKKTIDIKKQTCKNFQQVIDFFKETDPIWSKEFNDACLSKSRQQIIEVLNKKTSDYLEKAQRVWDTFKTAREDFEKQQNDQLASLLQRTIWECFQESDNDKVTLVKLWHRIANGIMDFYTRTLEFEFFQEDPRSYKESQGENFSNFEKLTTTKDFRKDNKKKVKDTLVSMAKAFPKKKNNDNKTENGEYSLKKIKPRINHYYKVAQPLIEVLLESNFLIFHSTQDQKREYEDLFLTKEELSEGKYNLVSLNPDFLKVKQFLKDFKYDFSTRVADESKDPLKEKINDFSVLKSLREKNDL